MLRRCVILQAIVALLAVGSSGCGKSEANSSAPGTSAKPAALGHGVIRGRVMFSGTPPTMAVIDTKGTCPHAGTIHDESIVVNGNGTLKNVLVFLKDVKDSPEPSSNPVLLDQVHCTYVPHVLGIQVGQPLVLKSSDDTMHNVHLMCQVNEDVNRGMSGPGELAPMFFKASESPFKVKCDIHPWMTAWIGVFDHPYFAVTGDDGTFEIKNVPAGTYTLAAWQEVLPQQEQQITVSDDRPGAATFTFRAP